MTPRMRKTRKVLFSSGAGVVMSTSEDCVGCHYGRAFSRASRPGNALVGATQGLALGLRSASGPCVSYQRGAAASADMRCSNMRLRTGHHQDHGLGERYDVISESFVVAAE